jgi:DNA transformation protein
MSSEFSDFLIEQMAGFGAVSARRMFGAAGLYRDSTMFAILADDVLYFRVDENTRGDFEAEGLDSFSYETKAGRNTIMSYMRAPERCMEDVDEMAAWCRKAYEAALRAKKPAKKAPRKRDR